MAGWRRDRRDCAGGPCRRALAPALAALTLASPVVAQGKLPDRLDLPPAPARVRSPESLLDEAGQAASRVTHAPTYGTSAARLVKDVRSALVLQRALAGVEGRWWPAS